MRCVVKTCKNSRTRAHKRKRAHAFFSIPKDEPRRQKWIEFCDNNVYTTAMVCQMHFKPEDFQPYRSAKKKPILKPDACPSIKAAADVTNSNISSQSSSNEGLVAYPTCESTPVHRGLSIDFSHPPITNADVQIIGSDDSYLQHLEYEVTTFKREVFRLKRQCAKLENENKNLKTIMHNAKLSFQSVMEQFNSIATDNPPSQSSMNFSTVIPHSVVFKTN